MTFLRQTHDSLNTHTDNINLATMLPCVLFDFVPQDWYRDIAPDSDEKGYYLTSLPVILLQMIEQNVTTPTSAYM